MCEFCPTSGTGTCAICGHKRVVIDLVYYQAGRAVAVVLHGRNRETIHQQCGGGRRVIRKKIGHS